MLNELVARIVRRIDCPCDQRTLRGRRSRLHPAEDFVDGLAVDQASVVEDERFRQRIRERWQLLGKSDVHVAIGGETRSDSLLERFLHLLPGHDRIDCSWPEIVSRL